MLNGVSLDQTETPREFKPQPETRVSIPAWLLPEELQELHQKVCTQRAILRELERDFNGMLRGYFQSRD